MAGKYEKIISFWGEKSFLYKLFLKPNEFSNLSSGVETAQRNPRSCYSPLWIMENIPKNKKQIHSLSLISMFIREMYEKEAGISPV